MRDRSTTPAGTAASREAVTPYPARNGFTRAFTGFASWTAHASGMPVTFVLAVTMIAVWAITGPLFHYSDTWQLVINTGTTIVTFLMVFLIQHTQNRDGLAIQVKLDELVRALETANNKFVGIEKLTEEEVETIREECLDDTDVVNTDNPRADV
jgi:low affinity Fe/Cu permease